MAFTIMYVYTEGETGMGLELGKKIRQLRKFSGMTQEQLAEKLHVSRQALSKWENDTSLPDLESVIKISRLFQISLEELLLEEKHVEENRIQDTGNEEYGGIIAGHGDDEQFALEDIGEKYDVLFTTDMTYEDGADM